MVVIEMLKNGGNSIVKWLLRILNRCMEYGIVPEDLKSKVIVSIHKGKSDRRECANYRGIDI